MKTLEQLAREARGRDVFKSVWSFDDKELARFRAACRAEALEEAAKKCDEHAADHEECAEIEKDERFAVYAKHERRLAAAIREMK